MSLEVTLTAALSQICFGACLVLSLIKPQLQGHLDLPTAAISTLTHKDEPDESSQNARRTVVEQAAPAPHGRFW